MSAKKVKDAVPPIVFVSWRKSLLGVPVRNEAAGVVDEGDTVRLSVALRRPWWLVPPISWIIKPRGDRAFGLDELGTEVWRLCDGERTVEQIIEAFAERHRLTFHEGRVSVMTYLKELMRRGLLVIAAEGGEEKSEGGPESTLMEQ
jgi:hypothetical protein